MSWYKEAQKAGWQEGWTDEFGDLQRYLYDAYTCKVYVTKLADSKITISTTLAHAQYGHMMWQWFWKFDVNDEKGARECYRQVKEAVGDVFQEFRSNEIPNNLLHSYLREAVRPIFEKNRPKTRIPFIDWAFEQTGVADWRNSIYGTRYPTQEIDGF